MREIKFRAWDGLAMLMPINLYGDIRNEHLISFSGDIYYLDELSNGNYCPDSLTSKKIIGLILMQFTGLKDEHGKEIYEGDIVKYHDHPTGAEDGTGSVYFKDGKWMVTWSMIPLGDFGTSWVEVIGNIYENPELLTP